MCRSMLGRLTAGRSTPVGCVHGGRAGGVAEGQRQARRPSLTAHRCNRARNAAGPLIGCAAQLAAQLACVRWWHLVARSQGGLSLGSGGEVLCLSEGGMDKHGEDEATVKQRINGLQGKRAG
jgi:hypothetical protein